MPKHLIYITLFLLACHTSVTFPPGGYDYPEAIAGRDTNFYYYPIRNQLSRLDSFRTAYSYLFYRQFDEPNLSIRPMPNTVFRLSFGGALVSEIFITLTEKEIIVKKAIPNPDVSSDSYLDSSRLTALQRWQLNILDRFYPLDDDSHHSKGRQHYLDSIGNLYPELYDVVYFCSLYDKLFEKMPPYYRYTRKKIAITELQYSKLVRQINASGYWRLPHEIPCRYTPMDPVTFTLEANTPKKYNTVSVVVCGDIHDSVPLLNKACQQLVHLAQMDKEISIYHDPADTTGKKPPLSASFFY